MKTLKKSKYTQPDMQNVSSISSFSQGLYLVPPQFETFLFKDVYSSVVLLRFKCEVLLGREENHNDVADE